MIQVMVQLVQLVPLLKARRSRDDLVVRRPEAATEAGTPAARDIGSPT